MQLEVLGPIRVVDDQGAALALGSVRQQRLLGVLALRAGRPTSGDALCEHLGVSPGALRVGVSRLRHVLGPSAIATTPAGYELLADDRDVDRFEVLLDQARAEPAHARQCLTEALALWRGDPYEPFDDEPWAQAEATRLTELRAGAVEDLVAALIDQREWTRAIALLGPHLAVHPYRDRPRALLMQALAESGRRREALRAFQEYRTLLDETFGTAPSAAIVELDRAIAREGEPVGGASEATATGVVGAAAVPRGEPLGAVPVPSTSFVGRDHDLRSLRELVDGHRLVTLTGSGGIGKTRLAVELVATIGSTGSDGAPGDRVFVDLVPVDAASLADHVATVLELAPQPGRSPVARVAAALAFRRTLLVLDNAEHVLAAAAELVAAILAEAPTVTIVVTSREALGLDGEEVWTVGPLLVDDPASSAVALFVERGREARPGFGLDEPGAEAAAVDLCRRLDGIPLAIELAAARLRSMSAVDLCDRLVERFRVLAVARPGPERHQTMRRAVAWSYDLLGLGERLVLLRAAVFAGGFDLAAAAAVCRVDGLDEAALLDVLDSLVRKSLVVASRRAEGPLRYSMEETIREFAVEELAAAGDEVDVRRRHAGFYAGAAVDQFALWDGPRQRLALDWVDDEHANLRAAYRHAVASADISTAAGVAAHVALMAMPRQRYDAAGWAEELLDAARASGEPLLPRLLVGASFCVFAGRVDDSIAFAQEAQAVEDDPRFDPFDPGWAAMCEANAWRYSGDADRFVALVAPLVGRPGVADVIGRTGILVGWPAVGRAAEAGVMAADAVAAAERYGNPFWIAYAHYGLGRLLATSAPDWAAAVLRDGLAYSAEHRLTYFEAILAREAATIQVTSASLAEQLVLLDEAIERFQHAGADATLSQTLAYLALVLARLDLPEEAAVLVGASARNPLVHTVLGLDETVAGLRETLGPPAFAANEAEGEAMTLVDAVGYARDHIETTLAALA